MQSYRGGSNPRDLPAVMRSSAVFSLLTNDSRKGLLGSTTHVPVPRHGGPSFPVAGTIAFPVSCAEWPAEAGGRRDDKMGIYLWNLGVISDPDLCCIPGTLCRFRYMWFCCGFRKQTPKEASLKPGAAVKASGSSNMQAVSHLEKQCGFPHDELCDPRTDPESLEDLM